MEALGVTCAGVWSARYITDLSKETSKRNFRVIDKCDAAKMVNQPYVITKQQDIAKHARKSRVARMGEF